MDIAIARVHVQGDEDTPAQHALVHGLGTLEDASEGIALEYAAQSCAHFLLPRHSRCVVLHQPEQRAFGLQGGPQVSDGLVAGLRPKPGQRCVQMVVQKLPAAAHVGDEGAGALHAVVQNRVPIQGFLALDQGQIACKVAFQFIQKLQLVADG